MEERDKSRAELDAMDVEHDVELAQAIYMEIIGRFPG